jgi:hypothetical protein
MRRVSRIVDLFYKRHGPAAPLVLGMTGRSDGDFNASGPWTHLVEHHIMFSFHSSVWEGHG